MCSRRGTASRAVSNAHFAHLTRAFPLVIAHHRGDEAAAAGAEVEVGLELPLRGLGGRAFHQLEEKVFVDAVHAGSWCSLPDGYREPAAGLTLHKRLDEQLAVAIAPHNTQSVGVFEALIRGKLSPSQENLEDLLTSMIFGVLRYLDIRVFENWMAHAVDAGGEPIRVRGSFSSASWSDMRSTRSTFWPWLQPPGTRGSEPDVVVQVVRSDSTTLNVAIEVKFLSGKHDAKEDRTDADSVSCVDQLAREWEGVSALGEAVVLYVTPALVPPLDDLKASEAEVMMKHSVQPAIGWLSMASLVPLLVREGGPWALSLVAALHRLGIVPFDGIRPLGRHHEAVWSFVPWTWAGRETRSLGWNFVPWSWSSAERAAAQWRFSK